MKSRITVLLSLAFVTVAAVPYDAQRIVGGNSTLIDFYPSVAALLFGHGSSFRQACGGTILNARSVLTSAHCPFGDGLGRWRIRMGSTWSNWGGIVHTLAQIIPHASYNRLTNDNDIAIMRTAAGIVYMPTIQPARTAAANYVLADNQTVTAVGWGTSVADSVTFVQQLRQVQIQTLNQAICTTSYANVGRPITANMLCVGQLDASDRGQCRGDGGSPIFHNDVVVGIYSFSQECTTGRFPGVNIRVSRYAAWINTNQ